METRAYIALGSNLGDREANLEQAIRMLMELATGQIQRSSFYSTEPEDMADEAGQFVNTVVAFGTRLAPAELLAALQEIEVAIGRPREHGRNESRCIDLDIICLGNISMDEPDLVLPHPRAHQRRFVLAPLAEIAPDLVLAGQSATVKALLDQLISE